MKSTILHCNFSNKNNCINGFLHGRAQCHHYTNPIGGAIRRMLEGWEDYACKYKKAYEDTIGNDGAIGPIWEKIGHNLLALLDGELGGWDAGSLHSNIRRILEENDCDPLP